MYLCQYKKRAFHYVTYFVMLNGKTRVAYYDSQKTSRYLPPFVQAHYGRAMSMAIQKRGRKSARVGVITKVLRILELLGKYPDGLQLKAVAEMTGINKRTALRFL